MTETEQERAVLADLLQKLGSKAAPEVAQWALDHEFLGLLESWSGDYRRFVGSTDFAGRVYEVSGRWRWDAYLPGSNGERIASGHAPTREEARAACDAVLRTRYLFLDEAQP